MSPSRPTPPLLLKPRGASLRSLPGTVQDPGDGTGPHLEVDGWTPWQYYVPEEELEPYYRDANALMMKLERMPPAVRARLERIEIRCPVKGCLLATVYWMTRRPTAEELQHERRDRPLRVACGLVRCG
jgi:hypothetical protein